MERRELIETIVDTIVARCSPKRVVLFGSRARGDARSDSDIDLFVEMESEQKPPERSAHISSLFPLHGWSMDVVVYTPEEVRSLRGIHGTLLSLIEEEGEVLYERE